MLSYYAAQSLQMLLDAFPAFKDSVKEQEDYFEIEIQSPSGYSLSISSACDELTVYFAAHHCHFSNLDEQANSGNLPTEDAHEVIKYVSDLMKGVTAIAEWYREGAFSLSYSFVLQDGPIPKRPNFFWRRWIRKRTVEVRTWA